MSNGTPRVSIGLPVYNGETYIREAIDSVLSQQFGDIELIIADNASTDATEKICREYAGRDARVRYFRHQKNLGAGRNYNFTFAQARGEFFKWIAHDDHIDPEFVGQCIEILDAQRDVVLCSSTSVDIDDNGRQIDAVQRSLGSSPLAHERFARLNLLGYQCEEVFGVIRTKVLANTRLIRNYTDSDRTLIAELALYGPFHMIDRPLFYHRVHKGMSTQKYPVWEDRMAWFDPELRGKITLPRWMQLLDYLHVIMTTPLSFRARYRCLVAMIPWVRFWKRKLVREIVIAICLFFRLPLPKKFRTRPEAGTEQAREAPAAGVTAVK